MASLKLLAAARNFSKQKELERKKKEKEELAFVQKVISQLPQAPTIDDIVKQIPQPINKTEVVKEVHTKEVEVLKEQPLSPEAIESMIRQQMIDWAEYKANDNTEIVPEIQVIREELDTDGLVTKEDLDGWLKKINNAILNNSGGGGGWRSEFATLDDRVDDLVGDLTELLTDIAGNTESLDKLEEFFERTICAIQKNKEELELLNARTEEAYETSINKEDLN